MQQQLFSNRSKQRQREQSDKKGRKIKVTEAIKDKIIEKWNGKWSQEQIAATVLNGIVSFKTIYNWLDSGSIKFDMSKLRRKGNPDKEKKQEVDSISVHPLVKDLKQLNLDKSLVTRNQIRLYLLDEKSKGCLTTFVEIKSRFYVALPMKGRTKRSIFSSIKK